MIRRDGGSGLLITRLDEPSEPNMPDSPPAPPEYQAKPEPKAEEPVADTWQPPEPGANYGKYPSGYDAKIRRWISDNFKDPDSVKYRRISHPRKEFYVENWRAHSVLYGWSVCAVINAKNGFGGYVGYHAEWFLMRDGEIVQQQNTTENEWVGHDHRINCDDGGK